MGNNTFLPPDTFESKIVVATIKRGAMRRYRDVAVAEKGGVLLVSYTATDASPGSGSYRVPLILAVERGKYDTVVFTENCEPAGVVRLVQGR